MTVALENRATIHAVQSDVQIKSYSWDWTAVVSAISGMLMQVSISAGGQLFVGELLLLAVLPILVYDRLYLHHQAIAKQHWLWKPLSMLLAGLLVTFMGYLLSDLYRSNAPEDFLRGWARLAFLGIDFLSVTMLISIRLSNIWFFSLGYSVLGGLVAVMKGVPWSDWKFGYSIPITLGAIVVLCVSRVIGVHVRCVILLALGLLNVIMDYRSLGAFCIVVGILGWLNVLSNRGGAKYVVGIVLSTVILSAFIFFYMATQGALSQRRQASNSIRLSSAMVGINAVMESPLIGYGSWARDSRFAKLFADVQFRMNKTQDNELYDFDIIRSASIPAHNQIIECWIEGGILGIGFFVCYFIVLFRGIKALLFVHAPSWLSPLLGYYIVSGTWALFMSPFKGLARVDIVLACLAALIACKIADDSAETNKQLS